MIRTVTGLMTTLVILAALASPSSLNAQQVARPLNVPADCPNGAGWTPTSAALGNQVECWQGTTSANLGYLQYLPAGYGSGSTTYPLIVFFHGIGERGNGREDLDQVSIHGPPKLIKNGRDFEAIVISPQLPTSQGSWSTSTTTPFVQYLLDTYRVDRDRVYVTGLSLGGGGTWMYAKAHPDIVAAAVPICGAGSSDSSFVALRGMPVWAFHREGDPTVNINLTTDKLKVITGVDPRPIVPGSTGYFNANWTWRTGQAGPQANENPIYTVYTGTSHDAWTAAYNNEAMWTWLFQQRRQSTPAVFQQDFQSSTSVSAYYNATTPNNGQFNDISKEATGGTWSINGGRLQIVRTGSGTTDNDAGITRHTDFPSSPTLLHVTFDVGVSNWTNSPYQSNAMIFSIGNITGVSDYGNGDISANTFQSLSVNGDGPGQFTVAAAGTESASLPADGSLHSIALFLNKTTAAASYRAPDGTVNTVAAGSFALWVDGALVVSTSANNGSSSSLTDLRLRFSSADNGTWSLDNFVIRSSFPQ
jgi:poly(3-hydroxybutyrate) depolymerase